MYYPTASPFASPRVRARIVIGLLAAGILLALLSMIVAIAESFLPTTNLDQLGEDPIALALVLATFVLLLIQGLLYLTTAIFFLTFIYRAHENLPALGTAKNRLQYSSGWMVGSFFVPFVSLVIPYRAVKELWQQSQPVPDNIPGIYGYQPDPPTYFILWWIFWIAANIGDNVLYRFENGSEQNALPIPWLAAVAHGLEICSAVLLMLVVNSIDKRQAEARASMGPGITAGPPPPPQFGPIQNQNPQAWP
jgi:hypothetical protein